MYKILSIDWDYFIDATIEERIRLFPDGNDYNSVLESVIWQTHYHTDDVKNIGINKKSYSFFSSLVMQQYFKAACLCNQHRQCYNFVTQILGLNKNAEIEIVNVDFHHDVYDSALGNVNSGNWLYYLMQEYKHMRVKWVKCKTSDRGNAKVKLTTCAETTLKPDFDALFVCRSGLYAPPHLDKYLQEFWSCVEAERIYTEDTVLETRYNEEFLRAVEQINSFFSKMT